MASSDDQDWQAAIGAWDALDRSQRNTALGYFASGDPALLIEAARAAAAPPPRDVGMEVRALHEHDARAVLLVLCDRLPAVVAQALDDYAGA